MRAHHLELKHRRAVVLALCAGAWACGGTEASTTERDSAALSQVAGDFDGDGRGDIAVGDPQAGDDGAGRVFLLLGTEDGLSEPQTLQPPRGLETPGFGAVLGALDLDGDGRDELLVGTSEANRVVVHAGAPGGLGGARVEEGEVWAERLASAGGTRVDDADGDLDPVLQRDVSGLRGERLDYRDMTTLQRHVAFFDRNRDGGITLGETYRGLRRIGVDPLSSSAFAVAINGALATPSNNFFPTLTIRIRNIGRTVHGSDTGVYDDWGRFDESRFDRLFRVWDRNRDGGLDLRELAVRTWREADLFDLFGVTASAGEFGLLWAVAAEDGRISRQRMREMYDGSLFYRLAGERVPWEDERS